MNAPRIAYKVAYEIWTLEQHAMKTGTQIMEAIGPSTCHVNSILCIEEILFRYVKSSRVHCACYRAYSHYYAHCCFNLNMVAGSSWIIILEVPRWFCHKIITTASSYTNTAWLRSLSNGKRTHAM